VATWKKQAQRKGSTGKGLIQRNSSGLLKRLPHQALLEQLADRQPAQIGRADPDRTRQFIGQDTTTSRVSFQRTGVPTAFRRGAKAVATTPPPKKSPGRSRG
jgi:hypothetical protein